MAKKKSQILTFVLIRETEHPIRQLRLKTWQLRALLVISLFLQLFAWGTVGYLRLGSQAG